MRKALLTGLLLGSLSSIATAQESIYSLSSGIDISGGIVSAGATSKHGPSSVSLTSVQVPAQASWFTGSRESGGFFFSVRMPIVSLAESWDPSWNSRILLFFRRNVELGYQFSSRLSSPLFVRWGPAVSLILNNGAYEAPGSPLASTGVLQQFSVNLGASSEVDYFPFDTGRGLIDGLHLLAQTSGSYSVTNFRDWNIGLRAGLGFTF